MQLFISDTYESMSESAAEMVLQKIESQSKGLLCPASGDSPIALYNYLVNQLREKNTDISGWKFVGLDEWGGMNADDEGSCRFYLNNQLFHPLHIPEKNICFFDGKAKNVNTECDKVENFIHQNGPIDIAIVGLGLNGHVGMNEPGTSESLYSHVAEIDLVTQQSGQKYFTKKTQLSQGLTLGIANLMEAKSVILIVSGSKKAKIVRQVLEEEISEQLPASLLRNHKNFNVFLDFEAAQFLKKKDK